MTTEELELNTIKNTTKNATKIIGPGSRLRKIREAKHVDIQEIAKRIRINTERLTQLENDDYHQMGAPTFAKGYLRAYANQLNLAKEEIANILQTFDDLNLAANIKRHTPELIHEKIDPSSPKTTRWIGYIIVMILLGLLAYSYYQHFSGLNKTANNAEPTSIQPTGDTNAPNPTLTNPSALTIPTIAHPQQSATISNIATSPFNSATSGNQPSKQP